MRHVLTTTAEDVDYLADSVFKPIAQGNAILFLGAGASVGEKMYLSRHLMQYYSEKLGIAFQTDDIVEFVDTLSADTRFDRSDFDTFIVDALARLEVSETHKTIARLNWKEIITTNCDIVLERAYDALVSNQSVNLRFKPILRLGDYEYTPAGDEVKYVKLNGCISDPQKYPLVFSSVDFANSQRFYRRVLRSMENLSPRIVFISVGYSFSDPFAKLLLKKFDNYNFRARKWMINVDPHVQETQLAYFSQNRIAILKLSVDEFFQRYVEWEQKNAEAGAERIRVKFSTTNNQGITLPPDLKLRLGRALTQLCTTNIFPSVDQVSFYRGEEPTFDTIRRNHDVVRERTLSAVVLHVKKGFSDKQDLLPIFALKGSYGTGKTTFGYRLVERLMHEPDLDLVCFEVFEPEQIQVSDLMKLLQMTKAHQLLLVFNHIELDSNFKALIDLRLRISMEQFHDVSVVLLGLIRENILQKYKQQHHYPNLVEIDIDSSLSQGEASELIEKLGTVGLVQYRDARQRQELINKVVKSYSSDTFTSLVGLLSSSNHVHYLLSAYNQLTKKAQEAFLWTSLLYRFGCLMPASLLRRLVSTDWDAFKRDILEIDCKGILIQVIDISTGTIPDLYFRTKHPIISDLLVKQFLSDDDKRVEAYLNLVQHMTGAFHNSVLLVDLLKSIRDTGDLSSDKLDKLFDACAQEFSDDPHFTLHYAINLQHRQDEESIQAAIAKIVYVEALLQRRSHRLIHRRAALNFELAKRIYVREKELVETLKCVREARELFEVKLVLDPFSSFAYVDFIRFETWCLDKIVQSDEDRARQMIKIEDLIDRAERTVFDDMESIVKVKSDYLKLHNRLTPEDRKAYVAYLESVYANQALRHLALILMFYFYRSEKNEAECELIIRQLENYSYLDAVAALLFQYYGARLHLANNRASLLRLVKENSKLADRNPMNYHFYQYVAAAYNRHFEESFLHVNELRLTFQAHNPVYRDSWRDPETGSAEIFVGIMCRGSGGRLKVRVVELQQTFGYQLGRGVSLSPLEGMGVELVLHFYLSGIRAEVIGPSKGVN